MRNTCSVDGCSGLVVGQDLCRKHYMRKWRKGSTDDTRKNARGVCSLDGCSNPHQALGLCHLHWQAERRKAELRQEKAAEPPRYCANCGVVIDPQARRRRGPVSFCSRKCKEAAWAGSDGQKQTTLRSYYKRRYGLTMEQVEELRAGGCQICGAVNGAGRWDQLHIDHCHNTGKVRGALCDSCNTGLGKFRDDPDLLTRAAAYLQRV